MASANVLLEKEGPPSEERLRGALGAAYDHFVAVRAAAPGFDRDWKYYGRKYGWKLRVFAADKSLLEATVMEGAFLVGMAIRQAEWQRVQEEPAYAELRRVAAAAKVFPEGYGVRVEVRDATSCGLALSFIEAIAGMRR